MTADNKIVFENGKTYVRDLPVEAIDKHKKRIASLTGQKVSEEKEGELVVLVVKGDFTKILRQEFNTRCMIQFHNA